MGGSAGLSYDAANNALCGDGGNNRILLFNTAADLQWMNAQFCVRTKLISPDLPHNHSERDQRR